MRLDLKTRKKICEKIFKRYQKAGKKDKGKILDGHTLTLDCNCDYLAHLLSNWGKKVMRKFCKYLENESKWTICIIDIFLNVY